MPHLPLRPTFLLLTLFLVASACSAADGDIGAPFVIGFERFARHQDIDEPEAAPLLLSELSCTACHAATASWLRPKRGPRLQGAGNRLRRKWMRRFIMQPHSVVAGTTMPDLLHGVSDEQRHATADAIVAFLNSQTEPFATLKAGGAMPVVHQFWRKGNVQRGGQLFHKVGCVACHEPDPDYEPAVSVPSSIDALIEQLDPEEIAELGLARAARRVPSIRHGDLAAKYSSRSLTAMLMDPASVRPDARMPSLRLLPSEAADIAAFLTQGKPTESEIQPEAADPAMIETGRRLFRELRCVNCHDTGVALDPLPAKPLNEIDWNNPSSCLNEPHSKMPRYHLDQDQRAAVLAFAEHGRAADVLTADQAVEHRMLQLNCYGCHERKGRAEGETLGGVGRFRKPYFETVGHADLGDEGRLPPSLSDVGRKLLPTTLESVFSAKAPSRRPYMTIRMPAYHHEAVEGLVERIPVADHVDQSTEDAVLGSAVNGGAQGLADIGRNLVNTGCVECHPFHGESLPGVVGIDVHAINTRVHPRWFLEFMRDPGSVKPRTRMPTFFPNGKSHRPDLLEGDVDRQIAAIWYYLRETKPLPQKIVDAMSKDFELSPTDHPIILRTFMRDAGNHAIAVGLPGGWNYAFDAEQIRLAIGWKGRFLDARGTWFERFAPPAVPLEEITVHFPEGRPFVLSQDSREATPLNEPTYRFAGYRLDAKGIPTLRYEFDQWDIEDRVESEGDSLIRTLVIHRSGRLGSGRLGSDSNQNAEQTAIMFRAHAAQQLKRVGPMAMIDGDGLIVAVEMAERQAGEVLNSEQSQQWLIPLQLEGERAPDEHSIKVEYRW